MQPLQILSIEEVFTAAKSTESSMFTINGVVFKKTSSLLVILKHGMNCVCCGKSGLYFISTDPQNSKHKYLRLMFEHTDDNTGEYAYMTKDHIVPKSVGGDDNITNYQPMCNLCNAKKANNVNINDFVDVNPYELLLYKARIRLFTILYHPNAKTEAWCTTIKRIMAKNLKQSMKSSFCAKTFVVAYDELMNEILNVKFVNRHTKQETHIVRPSNHFKAQNKT